MADTTFEDCLKMHYAAGCTRVEMAIDASLSAYSTVVAVGAPGADDHEVRCFVVNGDRVLPAAQKPETYRA